MEPALLIRTCRLVSLLRLTRQLLVVRCLLNIPQEFFRSSSHGAKARKIEPQKDSFFSTGGLLELVDRGLSFHLVPGCHVHFRVMFQKGLP